MENQRYSKYAASGTLILLIVFGEKHLAQQFFNDHFLNRFVSRTYRIEVGRLENSPS